jgi:hypothetical protein
MSDFVELDSSYGQGDGRSLGQVDRIKERLYTSSKDIGSAAKYQFKR